MPPTTPPTMAPTLVELASFAAGLVFVATVVLVTCGATLSEIGGGCTSTGTRLPGNAEPPLLPSDRILLAGVPAHGQS